MFTGDDLIHTYSRKQAIADGMLIPLDGKISREVGIKFPVCLTAGLYADLTPTEAEVASGQDLQGRLWDLLSLFRLKAAATSESHLSFKMVVARGNGDEELEVVAICGPGDDAEPVITMMLPGES